jgi:peptidoglycan/xylan/chitin deacetylase (PgdA/CDA1 family)
MAATFILSLDCEGKWGFCDQRSLSELGWITTKALTQCYRRLLNLFEEKEVRATFAFVGALTLSVDEYSANRDWFEEGTEEHRRWLRGFNQEAQAGRFDGWFAPDLCDFVSSCTQHEIGSHGFTHLPLDQRETSRGAFHHEMALLCRLPNFNKALDKTFVFPRNQLGYVEDLAEYGFTGYREALQFRPRPRAIKRLLSYASEFGSAAPQSHAVPQTPVAIPSGYFLNWRAGARRMVPAAVTIARWRTLIDEAVRQDGVVHLWSHPHNFISGVGMFDLLSSVLDEVHRRERCGELISYTQREYVRAVQSRGSEQRKT